MRRLSLFLAFALVAVSSFAQPTTPLTATNFVRSASADKGISNSPLCTVVRILNQPGEPPAKLSHLARGNPPPDRTNELFKVSVAACSQCGVPTIFWAKVSAFDSWGHTLTNLDFRFYADFPCPHETINHIPLTVPLGWRAKVAKWQVVVCSNVWNKTFGINMHPDAAGQFDPKYQSKTHPLLPDPEPPVACVVANPTNSPIKLAVRSLRMRPGTGENEGSAILSITGAITNTSPKIISVDVRCRAFNNDGKVLDDNKVSSYYMQPFMQQQISFPCVLKHAAFDATIKVEVYSVIEFQHDLVKPDLNR